VKQIKLFYPRNPTSTFRNGDVLGPLSESFPLHFNIHPCPSDLSMASVNFLSTWKIQSILLLTLDFAADSSRCS